MRSRLRNLARFFLLGAAALCITWSLDTSQAKAQKRIEFYATEYGQGLSIDPIGIVLGRMSAKFEWRFDPNFSYFVDALFDRDTDSLKTTITRNAIPTYSIGAGVRLYLRDNGAIEGLFGGVGLGLTRTPGPDYGIRISIDIGYKWVLGDSPFFLEPQFIVDAYPLRPKVGRPFFSYIALPFGIVWN